MRNGEKAGITVAPWLAPEPALKRPKTQNWGCQSMEPQLQLKKICGKSQPIHTENAPGTFSLTAFGGCPRYFLADCIWGVSRGGGGGSLHLLLSTILKHRPPSTLSGCLVHLATAVGITFCSNWSLGQNFHGPPKKTSTNHVRAMTSGKEHTNIDPHALCDERGVTRGWLPVQQFL